MSDSRTRYRYDTAVTISAGMMAHHPVATGEWPAWPDVIRYADLADIGVTRYALEKATRDGAYERIAPGVFHRAETVDDTTGAWAAIAAKSPEATLCLLTAASLHDLTDEIPRRSHIAIPRGRHPVTTRYAPITWHRFAVPTFDVGRGEHPLPGGKSIGLYSPERTIVDFFRARHQWGADLATTILKRWLAERSHTPAALLAVAKQFPHTYPAVVNTVEILL